MSKIVRFCSHLVWRSFLVSCFFTPNMSKIRAFLTIFKTLDPFILTKRKNCIPNFYYVARKSLIYLKIGPKVLCNNGHWDPFLTGRPYFRWPLCGCVWAQAQTIWLGLTTMGSSITRATKQKKSKKILWIHIRLFLYLYS